MVRRVIIIKEVSLHAMNKLGGACTTKSLLLTPVGDVV